MFLRGNSRLNLLVCFIEACAHLTELKCTVDPERFSSIPFPDISLRYLFPLFSQTHSQRELLDHFHSTLPTLILIKPSFSTFKYKQRAHIFTHSSEPELHDKTPLCACKKRKLQMCLKYTEHKQRDEKNSLQEAEAKKNRETFLYC